MRAILTYADRLAGRGHDVEVVVPERRRGGAFWRRPAPPRPDWMPRCRARIRGVPRWDAEDLPEADALVATAWQSAAPVAAAARSRGAKFYFVQHYESLYHGAPETVDATYRLPLRKIAISSWLREVMRERFGADAEVLVTPVERELFHPVPVTTTSPRPRVLMLHHDYAWKGVADGLEAVARARAGGAALHLVGFGVKPPARRRTVRRVPRQPAAVRAGRRSTAARTSICARRGTRGWACPPWRPWPAAPPSSPTTTEAAATTPATARRRWWRAGGMSTIWPPSSRPSSARPSCAGASPRPGSELVTTAFDWERAVTRMESILAGHA